MKRFVFAVLIIPGLLIFSVAAGAVEGPQQKPGLWETRMQHSYTGKGAPKLGTTQVCIDASSLAQGKKTADDYATKNCSKNEVRQEGSKWITDTVCKMGSSTMSNHSMTEFSGENAYHTEMTMTYDPPMDGRSGTNVTIDGKWLGACNPAAHGAN